MKEFDLEQVYDEQIQPLITQIIAICKEHKIPMGATFCFRNSEDEGEEYCSTFDAHEEVRGKSEHMDELWDAISPQRSAPALNMTVRNANGDVNQMIRIIG
jgi:hypothetical protein